METVLYILHVLVCVAMLPIILLQSGKGGGVSAVFGGGSGTVFGSRGASTFLTKMTTATAIIFMCTSMGLSWMSSRSRSVVPDTEPVPAQTAPAVPTSGDQVAAPTAGDPAAAPAVSEEVPASDEPAEE